MKTVNVHEAKTSLSALLSEVERGEDVVIARNGTPVARLVRVEPPTAKRQRGEWRALPEWKDFTYDPAIFAPMTDEEIKEEGWE
jgi:prevent-host-death family protein